MKKTLILFVVLFGCTQNYLAPRYTFTATFLDAFTNEPIKGFEIYGVDAVESKGIFNSGRYALVNKDYYSNQEGLINIPFHRCKKATSYEFKFYPNDKYFAPVNENIRASEYDANVKIKKTYKLNSKAQLRVKVNLKTPLKDGDKIRLIVGLGYDTIITNKFVAENKTYESLGNFPMDVVKVYTIGGVETRVQEKISLKPFVVNDYEFTY